MSKRIPHITATLVLALAGTLAACAGPGHTSTTTAHQPTDGKTTASRGTSPHPAPSPRPSLPGVSAPPSQQPSSPAPPVAVPPAIIVVRLGASFSPAMLRLRTGQQFLVTVSKAVQASGPGFPRGCAAGTTAQAANGLLSARCVAGGYLYTAEHAGTIVLSATIRPRCAAGTMCPQWISVAHLKITIT